MKAFVEGVDVFAEQSCHCRPEDAGELGLQQMAERAAEALASRGIIRMAA
jgi:hypothetical protein